MFVLTSKSGDNYTVYDSISEKTEVVDIDKLVKATKLGIRIIGVSIKDNKLRLLDNVSYISKLKLLSDNGYEYNLDDNGLIVLNKIPKTENVVIENRVNLISSVCFRGARKLKLFGGGALLAISHIFYDYIQSLDLSNLDTSSVTSMRGMIKGCRDLYELSLDNLNTSNVIDMCNMFDGCSKLTELNLSSFDTSNVKDMSDMFFGCNELVSIDLSSFDTSNVFSMQRMFVSCSKLKSLNLKSFDTSKVKSMYRMFANCYGLIELDLSNFNTSNVEYLNGMFEYCGNLTSLDICNFSIDNVINMESMFVNCVKLANLNIRKWDVSGKSHYQLFTNCVVVPDWYKG